MQNLDVVFTTIKKALSSKGFAISPAPQQGNEIAKFMARNPKFLHIQECIIVTKDDECVLIKITNWISKGLEPDLRTVIMKHHGEYFTVDQSHGNLEIRIPIESVETYDLPKLANVLCTAYNRILC